MHPTDAGTAPSLEDYAPRNVSTCSVCGLGVDLRKELESARMTDPKRFTYPIIARWLRETHQQDVSDSSLRRHFSHGHHADHA